MNNELTLQEAARLSATLGRPVTVRTLQLWCQRGWLPARRLSSGGRWGVYLVQEQQLRAALKTVPRPGRPRILTVRGN